MNHKINNVLIILFILISIIIILAGIFYKNNFAEQDFETLLFNTIYGIKNGKTTIIWVGFKENILNIFLCLFIFYIPIFINHLFFKNNLKKEKTNVVIYTSTVFIFAVLFGLYKIDFYVFLKNQNTTSTIFEDNFADLNTKISFPEKKRNLIYIFLESMETSLTSEEEGGGWEYTIIPELANLEKTNINFSNTEKLGGALTTRETTCTTSGIVAQTSGVPLKMSLVNNKYGQAFLPGANTLGDILKNEGYNLEIMFGSNATFGLRRAYFEQHGNYKIFDVNTAIEQGKMTEKDKVWWGFDDDNLFTWAKEEINDLAAQDKPFNFIMLTADTHFIDGYLSENAELVYDSHYENVFAYSSKNIAKFIQWIQGQDFYDNTTIVLVGDHIGMQTPFYKEKIKNQEYKRTIYNVFINSAIPEQNSKNRQFATIDIFPTVLASIGAKIDGDRLGLGTNLFSGRKTLIEEMGYEEYNKEVRKKSEYYNKYLLNND